MNRKIVKIEDTGQLWRYCTFGLYEPLPEESFQPLEMNEPENTITGWLEINPRSKTEEDQPYLAAYQTYLIHRGHTHSSIEGVYRIVPNNGGPLDPKFTLEEVPEWMTRQLSEAVKEKVRVAVLYDEDGMEIYRGNPFLMPLRFVDNAGNIEIVNAAMLLEVGIPQDEESEEDMTLHPAG